MTPSAVQCHSTKSKTTGFKYVSAIFFFPSLLPNYIKFSRYFPSIGSMPVRTTSRRSWYTGTIPVDVWRPHEFPDPLAMQPRTFTVRLPVTATLRDIFDECNRQDQARHIEPSRLSGHLTRFPLISMVRATQAPVHGTLRPESRIGHLYCIGRFRRRLNRLQIYAL